ncbi:MULTISPECIES: fimbrial protein [unclassified Serratia (in: enterobacteria)]|uniref:fimbrial protein n=1 Tax=unclassified Serratia (in: enterobacteria) TaxID=2647522 RepID=UPI0030763ABB
MKNVIFLAALCSSVGFCCTPAMASNKEIDFFGTVVNRPCSIEPQSVDQLVDMGTIVIKTLYRYEHTPPVPFSIKLTDCKTSVFNAVTVTFSGTEDPILPGKLAINNGANGAAIALFDSKGASIHLNQPTEAIALQTGAGATTLSFSAYVQGHPSAINKKTITEGEFSSVANFVLTYQ